MSNESLLIVDLPQESGPAQTTKNRLKINFSRATIEIDQMTLVAMTDQGSSVTKNRLGSL